MPGRYRPRRIYGRRAPASASRTGCGPRLNCLTTPIGSRKRTKVRARRCAMLATGRRAAFPNSELCAKRLLCSPGVVIGAVRFGGFSECSLHYVSWKPNQSITLINVSRLDRDNSRNRSARYSRHSKLPRRQRRHQQRHPRQPRRPHNRHLRDRQYRLWDREPQWYLPDHALPHRQQDRAPRRRQQDRGRRRRLRRREPRHRGRRKHRVPPLPSRIN